MEELIDHFHNLGDIPGDEVDDLLRTGMATMLLHDIGHGPLSHSSEDYFGFKHDVISAEIITRPPISDILEHDGIDPKRIKRILERTVSGRDKLLSQLASSELDADRLDYLARDSYFTGVGFGNVDLDRMIAMMRIYKGGGPLKDHAVMLSKGRFAIEFYVVGRHLMYQAVYFHKATRAAEKLVASAFYRARDLKNGSFPRELAFFESKTQPTANDIIALDDHMIYNTLRRWETSTDPILSELCKRVLKRNLLKAIDLPLEREHAYLLKVKDRFLKLAEKNDINAEYFCLMDIAIDFPYKPYRGAPIDDQPSVVNNIFVIDELGTPVDIAISSDVVRPLSEKKYVDRLYVPASIKADTERLLDE